MNPAQLITKRIMTLFRLKYNFLNKNVIDESEREPEVIMLFLFVEQIRIFKR